MIQNEYASNSKILVQIKHNIELMDQLITNLCRYLYVSSDVAAVMYAHEEDMADIATRLNKTVSSVASANPHFHSISIYNKNQCSLTETSPGSNASTSLSFRTSSNVPFEIASAFLPQGSIIAV